MISPMSLVFLGTCLRSKLTILMASILISMMLLIRASSGARGNAATKMVVKLNWRTKQVDKYTECKKGVDKQVLQT